MPHVSASPTALNIAQAHRFEHEKRCASTGRRGSPTGLRQNGLTLTPSMVALVRSILAREGDVPADALGPRLGLASKGARAYLDFVATHPAPDA